MNKQEQQICYAIAKHSGFAPEDVDNFKCFVTFFSGDKTDYMTVARVRYVSPDNENDWAYDVYIIEDYDYPSLSFMTITLVHSYHNEKVITKEKLIS